MIHDSAESVVFSFGKYKGYTLAHVIREHPHYIYWIRDNTDFSPLWREAVSLALQNKDVSELDLPRVKVTQKFGKQNKVLLLNPLNGNLELQRQE